MTAVPDYRGLAEAYARAHGEMRLDTVDAVLSRCAEGVAFHDPFNDTVGKAALRQVFVEMLKRARSPRTELLALYGGRRMWIVKWRHTASLPVIGAVDVSGLSELTLDDAGLVQSHIEYWDAGAVIYGRLPLVGGLVRAVRWRLSARSP